MSLPIKEREGIRSCQFFHPQNLMLFGGVLGLKVYFDTMAITVAVQLSHVHTLTIDGIMRGTKRVARGARDPSGI